MDFIEKQFNKKQDVKELARLFAHIFSESPIAAVIIDGERHIIMANKAAEMFDADHAKVRIGSLPGNFFGCLNSLHSKKGCGHGPACKNCIIRKTVLDTIKTGKSRVNKRANFSVERNGAKTGLDINISTKAINTGNGKRFVLVTLEDITPFLKSGRIFAERNEFLHTLVENLDEGIIIFKNDRNFTSVYVNKFAQKLLQIDREKAARLVGTPKELYPSLMRAGLNGFLKKASKGIIASGNDIPIKLPGGREIYLSLYFHPIYTHPGKVENIMGVLRDSTFRIQAENKLVAEKELLLKYINNANAIIVMIGHDRLVRLVNKKTCDTLGYRESEIIGKDWFKNFIPPEQYKKPIEEFHKLVSGKADFPGYYENDILCRNGERKLIAWNNTTLHDENGKFKGTLSYGYDITEHKKAESKLQEQNNCNELRAQIWNIITDKSNNESATIKKVLSLVGQGLLMYRAISFRRHGDRYMADAEWRASKKILSMMTIKLPSELVDLVNNKYKKPTILSIDDIYHAVNQQQLGAFSSMLGILFKKFQNRPGYFAPIVINGIFEGFFLFSSKDTAFWTDEKKALVRDACAIVSKYIERTNLEKQLERSDARLRLATNNISDIVWTVNDKWERDFVTPNVKNVLGHTPEELINKSAAYTFKDSDMQMLRKLMDKYRSGGGNEPTTFVAQRVRDDGGELFIETKVSPIRDANGKLTGFAGVSRDITERKSSERMLTESEQKFRALYNSISEASFVNRLAPDGKHGPFIEANDTAYKFFGYKPGSMIGMYPKDLIAEASEIEKMKTLMLSLQKKGQVAFESIARHSTGKTVPVEVNIVKFILNNEEMFLSTFKDISDRKVYEKALIEREKYFREITEESSDVTAVLNYDGIIRYVTPSVEKVIGFRQDEIQGKHILSIVPKMLVESIKNGFTYTLDKNIRTGVNEFRMKHKNGSLVILEVKWQNFGSGSAVNGIVVNARDITDKKNSEEKMKKIIWNLERTNDELEQFAYVASHDLKEPLRMISNYIELLEMRYSEKFDTDGREFLNFAKGGTKRMYELIQGLLAFSRIGKRDKQPVPVDLNKVAADILRDHSLNLPPDSFIVSSLPEVNANAVEMNQLFGNLIGNAVKFRSKSEKPLIKISAVPSSEGWEFCVSDNGIGMDEQYKEKVFGLFERLHADDEYPGTGIGLTICKKIVQSMGGNIWIETSPGKGTKIFFTLPKIEVKRDE